jgi:hypothetical protein
MNGDMHLCGGQWESTIGGANNGIFEFELDQQNGFFVGRHIYPTFEQFDIYGICRHPGVGGVHRIDIWEPETPLVGYAYYYFGIITPNGDGDTRHRANGRRHMIPKRGPIPEALIRRMTESGVAPPQDEEWVAVKTT